MLEKQRAVERMKQMQNRSAFHGESHQMPPAPDFVRLNNNYAPSSEKKQGEEYKKRPSSGISSLIEGLNIPFVSNIKNDSDATLILGMILILYSENSDRLLLLALLYILL